MGRAINSAVHRLLSMWTSPGEPTVEELLRLERRGHGRQVVIDRTADLSFGVFGQWLAFPGRDVVQVSSGVPLPDRTIAHELGHMVLGHRGAIPLKVDVRPNAVEAAALMLCRAVDGGTSRVEREAEQFASRLLSRITRTDHGLLH